MVLYFFIYAFPYLVIAREHSDRGDPVIIKSHAFACGHNLLDPGVKPQDDNGVCGGRGNIFLHSLTTPPLCGTPPQRGTGCGAFYRRGGSSATVAIQS